MTKKKDAAKKTASKSSAKSSSKTASKTAARRQGRSGAAAGDEEAADRALERDEKLITERDKIAKEEADELERAAAHPEDLNAPPEPAKGIDEGHRGVGGVEARPGLAQTSPALMNADHPLARQQQLSGGSPGTATKTALAIESQGVPQETSNTYSLKKGTLIRLPGSLRGSAPLLRLAGDVQIEGVGAPLTDDAYIGLFSDNQENWNLNSADFQEHDRVTGKRPADRAKAAAAGQVEYDDRDDDPRGR